MLTITTNNPVVSGTADTGGSKSISNRILILRALAGAQMPIYHASPCNDTAVLVRLLKENPYEWNAQDAGTAARFSAAYLATRVGEEHILTATGRMLDRPMKPLLDVLAAMGADITYMEREGFLPVKIKGNTLSGGRVKLPHDISSQFISALAMVAPYAKQDTVFEFEQTPLSIPYIDMTLKMLGDIYIHSDREYDEEAGHVKNITIYKGTPSLPGEYWVEPDWSSASYWYAAVALSEKGEIALDGFAETSMQGDDVVASLFESLGVNTRYTDEGMVIKKSDRPDAEHFDFDFSDNPDLAPTFAVVLPLLGIHAKLSGLETLRHKESDRVAALAQNLAELGIQTIVSADGAEMEIFPAPKQLPENPAIKCFGDHRMAMAFTPAVLKTGKIVLDTPEVVHKSYPEFWNQVQVTYLSSNLNFG